MGAKKHNRKPPKGADKIDFSLPSDLVAHPRYGTKPLYTGLKISHDEHDLGLVPGWKYGSERIIPNTGIKANTKHHCSAIPVYVYFDVLKKCVDCKRHFLFFAREQQHWYEELGFAVDADCIRCVECRKERQADEWTNLNYQRLLAKNEKTWEDYLELSVAALDLYWQGEFKALDRIRGFMNRVPESERHRVRFRELTKTLARAEQDAAPKSDRAGGSKA